MITLTRLSGSVFALNSDLIERVDSTPDTIITLVDGKKYVVAESMSEVIAIVRAHRAEVVALEPGLPTVADLFTFMRDAELRFETLRMRIEDRTATSAGEQTTPSQPASCAITARRTTCSDTVRPTPIRSRSLASRLVSTVTVCPEPRSRSVTSSHHCS